jgi:hypothetical protein
LIQNSKRRRKQKRLEAFQDHWRSQEQQFSISFGTLEDQAHLHLQGAGFENRSKHCKRTKVERRKMEGISQ